MQRMVAFFCTVMAPEAALIRLGVLSIALWCRVRTLAGWFCAPCAPRKAATRTQAPRRPSASSAVETLDRGERRGAKSDGPGPIDAGWRGLRAGMRRGSRG